MNTMCLKKLKYSRHFILLSLYRGGKCLVCHKEQKELIERLYRVIKIQPN